MPPKKFHPTVPESVRRNWAFPNPFHITNHHGHNAANLRHPSNFISHGFKTTNSAPIPGAHAPILPELAPAFTTRADADQYTALLEQKLSLACDYIHLENEHHLSPMRRMDTDPTASLLATQPLLLNLSTQQLVRNIVTLRPRIEALCADPAGKAADIDVLSHEFYWSWLGLREVLTVLVSGSEGVKAEKAEVLMQRVFGANIVEVDEGEDMVVEEEEEDGKKGEGGSE